MRSAGATNANPPLANARPNPALSSEHRRPNLRPTNEDQAMTYDSYKSLKVTKSNGIATVTINRPETLNAISMDVHGEIERIWTDIEHDDEVNVSILTGAGKCFS